MKKIAKVFGGGSTKKVKVATPPPEPEPAPMPDEEQTKRAAMREELRRRKTGRISTILSDDGDDGL